MNRLKMGRRRNSLALPCLWIMRAVSIPSMRSAEAEKMSKMKESVMFDKPHDDKTTLSVFALALGLALAIFPLSRVLGTEAV